MYGDWGLTDAQIAAILNKSLRPRGHDTTFRKMTSLIVPRRSVVLDVGCRDGEHACKIARKCQCTVVGVDPVEFNLKAARRNIRKAKLTEAVSILAGTMESLPFADAHFDLIWCRDVIAHVPDLAGGLRECCRVLKPGGKMLVYAVFKTDLLEPREEQRIEDALAGHRRNRDMSFFENAARNAGFTIAEKDLIGGEFREQQEEKGNKHTSQSLMQISRMVRRPGEFRRKLGEFAYDVELANLYYLVYIMLGKYCPAIYVLRKSRT